ncbi:uncharacterized protein LOC113308291 isoform X2 [Papaver somniferum]|uniref:uncharacterized protein LOC113308291 isoform X2 n=1 Tax=Papaver somniferum TaxID=3469 RepID=UPI000E6FD08D|nr:uncharacterized protein LOC113308291 isoform X2 [Papaver somniferum]
MSSSSSSSELLIHITRNRSLPSSRAFLTTRNRPEFISIFPFHKLDFTNSISLRFKEIHSVSCSSSTSGSYLFPETEGYVSNQETKSVQVKFQLVKDCLFGQDILVVGDDPIIGIWDPSNAIPLEWSDGHLWSVQLDIPINKSIQFKFILKEPTGEVTWQPGPDRILKTWETDKTIIIFEDWDNVELQMVTEEESTAKSYISQEVVGNSNKEDSTVNEEDSVVNSNTTEPTISSTTATEKMAYAEAEQNDIEKTSRSLKDEDTLFQYEGEPILVPGLAPLSTTTVEESFPQVFKNDIIVEPPTTPSNSNAVDVEVKVEEDYKPEKYKNEDLSQYTSQQDMITRSEFADQTDEEQGAGVGIETNCQSADEEMEVLSCQSADEEMELLDLPATDDVDILKTNLKRDDSFMHKLLKSLNFIIHQMN